MARARRGEGKSRHAVLAGHKVYFANRRKDGQRGAVILLFPRHLLKCGIQALVGVRSGVPRPTVRTFKIPFGFPGGGPKPTRSGPQGPGYYKIFPGIGTGWIWPGFRLIPFGPVPPIQGLISKEVQFGAFPFRPDFPKGGPKSEEFQLLPGGSPGFPFLPAGIHFGREINQFGN